jgi:hydroxymethylglutaryl-CoA lyase
MQIITRLHSLLRFGRFHRSFSQCKIVEVGPRDGLQNETKIVPTEIKVSLIHKLVDAGCTTIEVGAFVSPKWVPQMADSQQVLQKIHKYEGVSYSCLVPNIQGMMMATSERTKCTEVAIFASASETFSKKNINCTIEESLERFKPIMEMSKEKSIPVRGYVSCVLGCPYEGLIPLSSVIRVSEHLYDMGCYEISLGDTIGVGTPNQVRKLIEAVQVGAFGKTICCLPYVHLN